MYSFYVLWFNFVGITIRFSMERFVVRESNGPAEPVLELNKPIECCSISVWIKFEHGTTTGK